MMSDNFDSELSQLISMGYDPERSRNALEAAGGNVEVAVEILQHDETEQVSAAAAATGETPPSTTTSTTSQAEQVIDQWSQQLLGDKHSEVKERAKAVGKTAQSAWFSVVSKLQQVDQEFNISSTAKGAIKTCDEKIKDLNEKHDISGKASKAVTEAKTALTKTVETAKRSLS